MKSIKTTFALAAAAFLAAGLAHAATATDQIIAELTGQGFERIEIDTGLTQIKVEAIRGADKLEVVYDRATGSILKQEMERVDGDDDTAPGVTIRERNRDFVNGARGTDDRGRGRDDDEDDDDDRGRDYDHDDDRGRDDDYDDDRGRDDNEHGDDDSDDDDDDGDDDRDDD